ncbi:DUF2188 domain-containing protein [Ancylomarina longa]|uniref:DUF2188 domain-containing protein n=1 Tax=Ancylomarina longa TaxID=2487017 RepID=A0A434AF35_9BACT|nr:DUF2188 domain-containing protein [Ancylomarina longa]RUT72935.1 DUF2188 domain-containing protein [Ancylomarina longa]
MSKNIHVVSHEKGWAVRTEGKKSAAKCTRTQAEAIKVGRQMAKNNQSELVVHGEDGKIRQKNSYGNDPHPPKG